MGLGITLGCVIVIVHGNVMTYQRQTLFQVGDDITINGMVARAFNKKSRGHEAIIVVDRVNSDKLLPLLKPKIRLFSSMPLEVGDQITITVKMKPIFGWLNEAGIDTEKQAMARGIVAKAAVNRHAKWIIRSQSSSRQTILKQITEQVEGLKHRALILALAFNDRSWLDENDWRALRESGLIHLISISGLHIGMAYSFGIAIGSCIRYFTPRYVFLPHILGLTIAFVYAWLANFSLPTTRALSVCMIYIALKVFLVYWSAWRVILLALVIQLCTDPFSVLSISFWLSYLSVVAVLLTINVTQQQPRSKWSMLLVLFKIQLVLTVLIVPISGYFFAGTSLLSLFYNLFFIPWFAFIVVPLMFLALIISLLSPSLANIIWFLLDWSLWPLTWSSSLANGYWYILNQQMILLVGVVGGLMLFMRFVNSRSFALLFMVTLSLIFFLEKPRHIWRLDVLDVGHGLAVLIEKNNQWLLYDTGKAWSGGSIAERVITPILHQRGVNKLDTLIISHMDSDHSGGREYMEEQFTPRNKISSQYLASYRACVVGNSWWWQGLRFEVLWPPNLVSRAYNPHSCVIRIVDPISQLRVLLTGDIEGVSEWMLARQADKLTSDVMLVPHHGSKTSSNISFIQSVSPKLAIASLAKSNQWNMPAKQVVDNYQQEEAQWLDTGENGQITVHVIGQDWYFNTKRTGTFTSWYRQMLRKGVE
ncbi:DNA internalization-related competence protein ComEC/Rec2 [Vibrio sagamiensis NBRC 104589]|uniref:DNA internalization-related competence protein ComEC/Rec2 n=2 Tax=Vibrio sagamiensis TaxID=512650 RepID=A0A511QC57_9VIBR|nr:DNA internalization-related competence protein ComEC/Rec2 [Vibrio sagamiensis NBRC 104589]